LDTSTWWGGVALVLQDADGAAPKVVAELGADIQPSHEGHLLPRIEWLLGLAGWSKSDPDAYIATRGPGSFTGIRVGLGTIQGLGISSGRPCVGIDTLDAVVEAHGPAELERVALIAAGRGDLYGARYDAASSPPLRLEEPWLRPLADLAGKAIDSAILIFGPGCESEAAMLGGATPRSIAAAAGRLALLRGLPEGGGQASLSPLYLRPPDAELKPRKGG
jgi:tRNA threonylcarbamoyladenosine biosynthesis protein TsaB